jgi:CDP-diacylglycerol--glycerol-3-phosphate 3-phosphatidyltransferase
VGKGKYRSDFNWLFDLWGLVMKKIVFIGDHFRTVFEKIISPIGAFLARIGIPPNFISVIGLILSITAGLVYATGSFFWAAWVVVLAGCCDTLDGILARSTGKETAFGAFFDSTLDRYSDMFILTGLVWVFAGGPLLWCAQETEISPYQSPLTVFFIIMAMVGSFMVSYTRARAEGLGVDCRVGFLQRPERIILLIIGSLMGSIPFVGLVLMKLTLLVLAVLSNLTAIQRMIYVRNQLAKERQIL